MSDKELLSIADQTAKILKKSNCGMYDVVSLIRLLAIRVKELNYKANKMTEGAKQ